MWRSIECTFKCRIEKLFDVENFAFLKESTQYKQFCNRDRRKVSPTTGNVAYEQKLCSGRINLE